MSGWSALSTLTIDIIDALPRARDNGLMNTATALRSAHQGDAAQWLTQRLRELADQLPEFDRDLGNRDDVFDRLVAAVVPPSRWSDVVGPVYTGSGLARKLGITRQAIHNRTKQGTVWALHTADNHVVYPASQFTADMSVFPELVRVLRCFDTADVDEWTLASWLNAPTSELAGQSPLDAVRDADPLSLERVLKCAKHAAARWAH